MKKAILPLLFLSLGCASGNSAVNHSVASQESSSVTNTHSAEQEFKDSENSESKVIFKEYGCRGFSVSKGFALFEHRVYESLTEDVLTLDDLVEGHKISLYDFDGDMHVDALTTAVYMMKPSNSLSDSERRDADALFAKYFSSLKVKEYFKLWKEKYMNPMKFY